jgi:two-component system, OmpR family, sensor kinase
VAVAGAPDGRVQISVVDHGPGVPAGDRERVFERFVQLDSSATRSVGGTGLGLYVCRKLAESQQGTITLDDTPGGGCTFTLELPAAPPTAERTTTLDPLPFARPVRSLATIGTE